MKKRIAKDNDQALIDEIQKVRTKNNGNWMDILRLAFKYAPPGEAANVMARITACDKRLNELSAQFGKGRK